uniref:Protein kinase domain-containing protein n=1 Tax=Oryza meridionalis TaxID=40149 RepID=A0A0E0F8D8_9ORYZ
MISHADLTRRLEKLANSAALSACSSQVNDEFEKGKVVTHSINDVERHEAERRFPAADATKAHIVPRAIELSTLSEVATATMNFSPDRKIYAGSFGNVYKGMLPDGQEVAIKRKRVDSGARGTDAFHAEVRVLSPLHHKHIIRLVGCCVMDKEEHPFWKKKIVEERILIFEYMKNGSLSDHLHGPSTSSSSSSSYSPSPVVSSWKTRIEILLGVSRAIEYLHSYAVPPVIHHGIRPSNILLDSSWSPRLSSFDVAVQVGCFGEVEAGEISSSTTVFGTLGYLDPEYLVTGQVRPASDVYSFGVVMLEVLSGRGPIFYSMEHGDGPMDLVCQALPLIDAGQLLHLLDRRPAEEPTPRQLEAADLVARTAAHCLQENGDDRPAMSDVVTRLQAALELVRCDDE